jgi:hypothetical protein
MRGLRKQTNHILSLDERLMKFAKDCRTRASLLKPGQKQEQLLEKARQFDARVTMNELFQR